MYSLDLALASLSVPTTAVYGANYVLHGERIPACNLSSPVITLSTLFDFAAPQRPTARCIGSDTQYTTKGSRIDAQRA